MTSKILTAIAALGLTATTAFAYGESMMGDYDSDGDLAINEEEFRAGFAASGGFDGSDTDGDGMLSREEYDAASFRTYDQDGSGDLDEMEFAAVDRDFAEGGRYAMESEED